MASIPSKRLIEPVDDEIVGRIQVVGNEASEKIASVAVTAAGQGQSVRDAGKAACAVAVDRLEDLADRPSEGLENAAATGRRLARQSRRQVGQGVRRHPVEALMLASAIGYLVGWASIRR